MQKYISKTDISDICYFEDDVIVSDWIDLAQYRLMTEVEILKHETPKPSEFHTEWNGTAWVDPRTDAEKRVAYLASMPELTKRQFNLYLYDTGLKDEVDALLAANPRAKVEFDSTDKVVRTSPTVEAMITLLGWTDEQVDQMWQQALTL